MTLAPLKVPELGRHQVAERLLLTMSAGAVNAGAYLACQRFVSHVTGTVTLIGVDFGSWSLVAQYLLVLMCFLVGAMAAVILIARGPQETYPITSLRIVALTVALVAPMGMAGLFGPISRTIETPGDFVLLSILSFAMGMLNSTVAASTAIGARVTHLTGHATELGMNLARICVSHGEEKSAAIRRVLVLTGKFFCFAAGAAVMVKMVSWGYAAFLGAAAMTLAASELGRFARQVRVPRRTPSWHAEPSYPKAEVEYTAQPSR